MKGNPEYLTLPLQLKSLSDFSFHRSETDSSDAESIIPLTPANITLDCPSINEEIYNTTNSIYSGTADSSISNVPFQFKQFCNKAVIVESSNMSQITDAETSETDTVFENPSYATGLSDCISKCTYHNVDAGHTMPCFGAWFDANQTSNLESANYDYNNCYLYTMAKGNFTLADILVESGGLTAMAVMVSWDNDTFVGTYLSDNGDWSGGVTTTGVII